MEDAVRYALGAVRLVTPEALHRPTPCRGWDLRMLLRHVNESVAALLEGVGTGAVGLGPGREDISAADDPVETFRLRAAWLLAACTALDRPARAISIAGCPLSTTVVAGTGALEIAVHGWDIAQSCGQPRPVPPGLADELLALSPLIVPADEAHGSLFAPPVALPPNAAPGDRLVAFLGRVPGRGP